MVLNNPSVEPFNCIAIDNRASARQAVEYLVGLGHKKIATVAGILTPRQDRTAWRDITTGWIRQDCRRTRNLLKKVVFLRTPARSAAQALLKDKDRPTAIFAASDVMAFEIIDVAKSLGIKVPEDLSVVGFDNNLDAGENGLKLVTFEQPIGDMARLGIESLYQMSLGLAKLPVKMLLEAKLVKGRSSATLR